MSTSTIFKAKHLARALLGLAISPLALGENTVSADTEAKETTGILEEVVVISSRYPVPLSEVVGSVATISGEDIAGRMVNDLQSLMATTVGVSVKRRQAYGRVYNEGISIRGLGSKRVNILIDGVRVADAYTGYGRDLVDMDLLKRVEILKGPSSALYGSDGLAGAVSYITKDPEDLVTDGETYVSALSQFDSDDNRTKLGVLSALGGEKVSALVQLTKHQLNERELHSDATLTPNPMDGDQETLFFKTKYALSNDSDISLTADMQRWQGNWDLQTDLGMSFFPGIVNTSESLGTDEGKRDRFSLEYSFSKPTLWFDQGRISVYQQKTDQTQITNRQKQTFGNGLSMGPTGLTSEITDYQFNQSIKGLGIEMAKTLTTDSGVRHQVVYGAELESIDSQRPRYKTATDLMTGASTSVFGSDVFPNKTFPDTETERKGLFVNDRITLNDRAVVVVGLRYDGHTLDPQTDALFANSNASDYSLAYIDDSAISTKLGFLYDMTDQVSVFAQYAEGFRSPDYESANLTFTNFAYRYSVAPNPELEAEESAGYEVGLRGNHSDVTWSLALYDTDYEKFIETALTGTSAQGISIYQYVNLSDVTIRGAEVEVRKTFSDNLFVKFAANRTYGESAGEKLTTISPADASISLSWRSDDGKLAVRTITSLVASGPSDLPPSCGRSGCNDLLEVSGRGTHDVFVDYLVTKQISARLGVTNVTDKKYWDWGSVNGKVADDPELDLFLESGRAYSAEVKYRF